jgi:hypothetical protein
MKETFLPAMSALLLLLIVLLVMPLLTEADKEEVFLDNLAFVCCLLVSLLPSPAFDDEEEDEEENGFMLAEVVDAFMNISLTESVSSYDIWQKLSAQRQTALTNLSSAMREDTVGFVMGLPTP